VHPTHPVVSVKQCSAVRTQGAHHSSQGIELMAALLKLRSDNSGVDR
jgi:hypothetical protein